jgi:hypothetical protein
MMMKIQAKTTLQQQHPSVKEVEKCKQTKLQPQTFPSQNGDKNQEEEKELKTTTTSTTPSPQNSQTQTRLPNWDVTQQQPSSSSSFSSSSSSQKDGFLEHTQTQPQKSQNQIAIKERLFLSSSLIQKNPTEKKKREISIHDHPPPLQTPPTTCTKV